MIKTKMLVHGERYQSNFKHALLSCDIKLNATGPISSLGGSWRLATVSGSSAHLNKKVTLNTLWRRQPILKPPLWSHSWWSLSTAPGE